MQTLYNIVEASVQKKQNGIEALKDTQIESES